MLNAADGHRIIAVVGTTSSGKSMLGIQLVKRFKGVVVSADSRQVYRGLNIGSGKVTRREMAGVPHYLLDIASPRRVFTVAQFQRAFNEILAKLPISVPIFLVGGSPFYIQAAISQTSFPAVPPNIKIRRGLEKKTTAQLLALLQRQDPKRAKSIERKNRRRIIRALEIIAITGKPVPELKWQIRPNVLILGLTLPRPKLYRAIDLRVETRIKQGMISEVRRLHKHGLSWKRLESLGLEYRELARYIKGEVSRDAAIQKLKFSIHAFARRQLTWFRKMPNIHWISTFQDAKKITASFLNTDA